MKKNIAYCFTAIIIINAIGILLRYAGLDTYFIIIGFRFQLSLFLPALFISAIYSKDVIVSIFRNPSYKGYLLFIFLLTIPLLILFAILFFLRKIELGDPGYLYEFGISSIIDFPVYLAWNSIQLILFFLFFIYLTSKARLSLSIIFLIFVLLFVYELIPLKHESFDYINPVSLIFLGLITGFIVKYYQNIYWLVVFSFSLLWLDFLLFGSNSEMAVNLLFASQYNSWEGFFSVDKGLKAFILPAHLLLVNIFIINNIFKYKSNNKVNYIDTGN
ncbi:MAG: hypothetical protein WCE54_09495 [Ignavibacteriaceae bacterium]